jgi:hypothetical protein
MSRFSMAVVIICVGALSVVTSGCAGELTEADKERPAGAGGSGGSGAGGSGGSGGSAGSGGGNPETCLLAMTKDKSCGIGGCHGTTNPSAGLTLTDDALRQAKDSLVDKTNKGMMPGCPPGAHKLIDKAQPEKSLLYTKLTAQPPCGERMPSGGSVSDAQLSCMLAWIKSVASAP